MQKIYLDNNATTALDPEVLQEMLVDLQGLPANPSSVHWFGKRAYQLLQEARETVASFFGARPEEIVFTSGGTESANLFLRGLESKGHLITSTVEHSCIYRTSQLLESRGFDVTHLPVGPWGAPTPEEVLAAIRPDTKAIALSAANNETGVKIDLEAIAQIACERAIPLFIDAVCCIGKEPFQMYPGITALSVSGHKFHAPKGTGVLYLRAPLKINPLCTGGFQEYERRAGTENLSGILGLARAFAIVLKNQTAITKHLSDLQSHLEKGLKREIPDLQINGEGPRICNTSNFYFPGVDGETLLIQLDRVGIAVSHGSACASGAVEPSRVLLQMGMSRRQAHSSLRFSLGKFNTIEEIDQVIAKTAAIVNKLSD